MGQDNDGGRRPPDFARGRLLSPGTVRASGTGVGRGRARPGRRAGLTRDQLRGGPGVPGASFTVTAAQLRGGPGVRGAAFAGGGGRGRRR